MSWARKKIVEGIMETEPTFTLYLRAKVYRQGQREYRNWVDQCYSFDLDNLDILAKTAGHSLHSTSIKIVGWWVMGKAVSTWWCLWILMHPALCKSGRCHPGHLLLESCSTAHDRSASWQRGIAHAGVTWWGQAFANRATGQKEQ